MSEIIKMKKSQNDYNKNYKEKIIKLEQKYKICEICGEKYYYSSKYNHEKTKLHLKILKIKEDNNLN